LKLFLYGKICELGSQGRGPLEPSVYRGPGTRDNGELTRSDAVDHWWSSRRAEEEEEGDAMSEVPSVEAGRQRGGSMTTVKVVVVLSSSGARFGARTRGEKLGNECGEIFLRSRVPFIGLIWREAAGRRGSLGDGHYWHSRVGLGGDLNGEG
jgi:hypothetical protein